MKYWECFELTTQLAFASLLSNTRQKDLFLETNALHEKMFMDFVCRIIKPDLFLEIGAHEAAASKRVASNLPDCKCYAFEADPSVYQKFQTENVQGNVIDNFQYVNMAISDHVGMVGFQKQVRDGGPESEVFLNNSLLKKGNHIAYNEVSVHASTVDEFCKEISFDSAVLRIDVEGVSHQVLSGARETLKKCAAIYAEVEDYEIWQNQKTVFEVYSLMDECGFVPISRDFETPGQFNLLFLPSVVAYDRKFRGPLAIYHRHVSRINEVSMQRLEGD